MRTSSARQSPEARAADVFAALGDATRLRLVRKLTSAGVCSISELTEGTRISRQAVTKHLRVLEGAGLAHATRAGRESLYEFNSRPLKDMREYLDLLSEQWDDALTRLKNFVE